MRISVHEPERPNGHGIGLTHGAGGNAEMPLLVTVAKALSLAGFRVVRFDLPFRTKRASGPPAGNGAADREGVREMARQLRSEVPGLVFMGGQSYGGRQTTMAAGEDAEMADGLILFSYPLHPPGKPDQPRTAHFPTLRTPCVFIQGTRDPFGSVEEVRGAIGLIPARTQLSVVDSAGHDLKRGRFDAEAVILKPMQECFKGMFDAK